MGATSQERSTKPTRAIKISAHLLPLGVMEQPITLTIHHPNLGRVVLQQHVYRVHVRMGRHYCALDRTQSIVVLRVKFGAMIEEKFDTANLRRLEMRKWVWGGTSLT